MTPPAGQGGLVAAFGRGGDRVPAHAPDVVLGLEDRPPPAQGMALALQHVAIQAIYFVLPGMVAAAFGAGPLEATNYLCLSLIPVAASALLQALTRGPVGSGYAIPAIPSVVMFAPLMLAAQMGASLAQASLMVVLAGVVIVAVAPAVRRLSRLMPTEVMGVVVFLIGASMLPTVMSTLRLDPAAPATALRPAVLAFCCFALMVIVGVLRWRYACYAVLVGALVGTGATLALGMAPPEAGEVLARAPWFALPRPLAPAGFAFEPALLGSFLLGTFAAIASMIGTLVAFQRATDGAWTRPDPGPLRRGMLAHGLAATLAGAIGGMPPAASSASVGVSIATRTFARSIAVIGGLAVLALAFSPRLAALFVLVPAPVQAAMLLYVAGFMMAQGCEMVVMRSLDTRRTVVAGLGLSLGLAALAAPAFFAAAVPALASPLALGGISAFLANLVTLPLVKREDRFVIPLRGASSDVIEDRTVAMGGAWGLRPETVRRIYHALMEFGDLLAGRGLREMTVGAEQVEERVRVVVAFASAPLPRPNRRPRATDLEAGGDALEAAALWLTVREATRHGTRATGEGQELWMEFDD